MLELINRILQEPGRLKDGVQPIIEKVSNTYDGFNRLRTTERIREGERVVVSFLYDGDGLRTEKRERSSKDNYVERVTKYTYDRQYVILETDGSNNLGKRYIRGINYIASIDKTERLAYFLFNGHGDVVHTMSESGAIENRYEYDIFGNPTLSIELYANEIRYAGEFFDVSTGLYYLRARYYNPYTGRFITEDSYRGKANDPLSLNLYTYGHNDPIMYTDPSGHKVLKQGEKSDAVKMLQEKLSEAGYPVKVDGVFGPKTKAAVAAFQENFNLKVDGIVGNQTLTALNVVGQLRETGNSGNNASADAQRAQAQAIASAKPGQIKDNVILMSSGTFNGQLKAVETVQKPTGGSVKYEVKNNAVQVIGVIPPTPKQTGTSTTPNSNQTSSKPMSTPTNTSGRAATSSNSKPKSLGEQIANVAGTAWNGVKRGASEVWTGAVGAAHTIDSNITGGMMEAIAGSPTPSQQSKTSYQVGQIVGDSASIAVGAVEVIGAFALGTTGVAISATGIGSVVGAPAVAGAAALGTHGSVTVMNGTQSLMDNTATLFNGSGGKGTGNDRKTSQTFGQPIETVYGGQKVKLRVDAEPDGNKIQIQAGKGKDSTVDIRINPNAPLEEQIPKNLKKSLSEGQYKDLLKNLQKAVDYLK